MKPENLLNAMTDLDDDLVLDIKNELPKRKFHKRRLAAVLTAAIVASSLIGCAYTVLSEADWFQDFFTAKANHELSENQAAYIQENTQEITQSATLNGYTLTIESAIADQYNAYIKLRLQSPAGTVLDAESYLPGYKRLENGELEKTFYREDGRNVACGASWSPLDDGDPKDDSFSILYKISLFSNTEVTFDEEGVWKLRVRNMDAYYDSGEQVNLFEGAMDFDIVFTKISGQEVVLVSEPIPYTFITYQDHDAYLNSEPTYTEGAVTSVILRSMSAEITIEGIDIPVGFYVIPIIMKDGSTIEMKSHSFGNGHFSYSLDAPIILEEVDYVLLENGTKLPMPQE